MIEDAALSGYFNPLLESLNTITVLRSTVKTSLV
jgi:hypothetical protein